MYEEKLVRKITEIGNGAHIFVPREWLNEEVTIIRMPRRNAKEEIIKLLYSYLDKIIAVFLYGSYARQEQDKDSDMDIFVIARKKFQIKSPNKEIIVVPEDKIEYAKKLNPILFYSMIQEAKPIINSSYLEKLKKEKIKPHYFKEVLEDTKRAINSNKEIIKLDEKLKNNYASESVIYSLILRLRGVFIINLLLNRKKYSNELLKDWLIKKSEIDYNKIYNIYRAIRNDKKPTGKASIKEAESLLSLLIKEVKKLENDKKKEKT